MNSYYRSDGWVKDVRGPAIPGAQVYVCTQPANVFPPVTPPRTTPVPWAGPNPQVLIYSDAGFTPIVQPTTGTVEFHVKIPSLSSSVDTVIYLIFDNASISTDQQNAVAVWSNSYDHVYHFGSPTVLSGHDSVGGLDMINSAGTVSAAAGQIGGAVSLSPAAGYTCATATQVSGSTSTAQFWLNSTGFTGGNGDWWMASGWNGPATSGVLFRNGNSTDLDVFGHNSSGFAQSFFYRTAGGVLVPNVWMSLAVTYTGSTPTVAIYKNAALLSASHLQGSGAVGSTSVGNVWASIAPNVPLTDAAKMDEMRVSNVVRSPDWLLAEYNNQSSPSTFYTVS